MILLCYIIALAPLQALMPCSTAYICLPLCPYINFTYNFSLFCLLIFHTSHSYHDSTWASAITHDFCSFFYLFFRIFFLLFLFFLQIIQFVSCITSSKFKFALNRISAISNCQLAFAGIIDSSRAPRRLYFFPLPPPSFLALYTAHLNFHLHFPSQAEREKSPKCKRQAIKSYKYERDTRYER